MTGLTDHLEERYPLLTSLRIADESQSSREPLPHFLGLLLSAAESPDLRSCCFVFPDSSRIACTAAALFALSKLTHEFDDLVRDYAQRKFEIGQRVLVQPTGHVYEYAGVWNRQDGYPSRFKLKVLGKREARSFWASEILRLEPTARKTPKGQSNTPLGQPGQSGLDALLGIASGGNKSLFRNQVVYLTSRSKFEAFSKTTALHRAQNGAESGENKSGWLHETLPWGSVNEDGSLVSSNQYQVEGEPLLAVTHSVENVAEASALAEPFSRVVFADGPGRLTRNLQAFDEITDSQKLIIVADHESDEELSVLEDRGCCTWSVSPEEIRPGTSGTADTGAFFFGRTFKAAHNYKKLKLDSKICHNEQLEKAANSLQQAGRHVDRLEDNEETKRSLTGLLTLLFSLSDRCSPLEAQETNEFVDRLGTLERDIERRAIWVPTEVTGHLRNACLELRELVSARTAGSWIGQSKGEALLETIREHVGLEQKPVVVTRYSDNVDATRRWLQRRGADVPVFRDRHFPEAETCDIIIVLSWLNAERFGQLVRRYAAPHVCLLSYPFEQRWLRQFDSRFSRNNSSGHPDRTERAKLLGIHEDLLPYGLNGGPVQPQTGTQDSDSFSIFDLENRIMRRRKGAPPAAETSRDTLPARYIGFVGDAYAYLTANYEAPVVTDMIKEDAASASSIPVLAGDRLQAGDLLLFREGSDRNVVRLFAEEMMGSDLYAEQRTLATSWRRALLSLGGSSREVYRYLRSYGLRRTEATVRNWLRNESIIGPMEKGDLEIIARAVEQKRLPEKPTKIREAIENIWDTHRQAGHSIRAWLLAELAEKRDLIAYGEASVDLEFGRFWVVEVEESGSDLEQYPEGQVNRLLWENGHGG